MGKNIFITDFDMKRFQWLISNAERFENSDKKHLWELEKELVTATIVDPHQIPSDIVTMHSKVRLRNMVSGEENVYTLVFPFDADLSQNRLSILAPEGVAIIGC
ncbi:MAG: GreA/GreB family elongation factor, partial [Ignavibacteriales bacterium]